MNTQFNWSQEIYDLIIDIDAMLESRYDSTIKAYRLSKEDLGIIIKFVANYYLEIELAHELSANGKGSSDEIYQLITDSDHLETLDDNERINFLYEELLPRLNLDSPFEYLSMYFQISQKHLLLIEQS